MIARTSQTFYSSQPLALIRVGRGPAESIIAINGPWGFTSLRIWSLTLNTIQQFFEREIAFFSMTKIELFSYCIQQNFLPARWLIGIGQKKKMWWVDRQDWWHYTQTMIWVDTVENWRRSADYFVDFIGDHMLLEHTDTSLQVGMSSSPDWLFLKYKNSDFIVPYEAFKEWWPQHTITPAYMIEPTLS